MLFRIASFLWFVSASGRSPRLVASRGGSPETTIGCAAFHGVSKITLGGIEATLHGGPHTAVVHYVVGILHELLFKLLHKQADAVCISTASLLQIYVVLCQVKTLGCLLLVWTLFLWLTLQFFEAICHELDSTTWRYRPIFINRTVCSSHILYVLCTIVVQRPQVWQVLFELINDRDNVDKVANSFVRLLLICSEAPLRLLSIYLKSKSKEC